MKAVQTRIALSRVHTSAKAADVANLFLLNKHLVTVTFTRTVYLGGLPPPNS